jgi:hypothetical protein
LVLAEGAREPADAVAQAFKPERMPAFASTSSVAGDDGVP